MSFNRLLVALAGVTMMSACAEPTPSAETDETEEIPDDPGQDPGDPTPPAPPTSSREQLCDALSAVAGAASAPECVGLIAADCEAIVTTFADGLVDSMLGCVLQGGAAGSCIGDALSDLQPAPAHYALAEAFCEECTFGLPGCEEAFYFGDEDNLGIGMVALPFSADVVTQIATECTEGATCALDFPSCARDILEARLVPRASLECLLDAF